MIPGSCMKVRFRSRALAREYAARRVFYLRPYVCPKCRLWHLTSQTLRAYRAAKQESRMSEFRHQFDLPVGAVVQINGIPVEHLGAGRFGGNTDPCFAAVEDSSDPVERFLRPAIAKHATSGAKQP
jgi:hypothetical protein